MVRGDIIHWGPTDTALVRMIFPLLLLFSIGVDRVVDACCLWLSLCCCGCNCLVWTREPEFLSLLSSGVFFFLALAPYLKPLPFPPLRSPEPCGCYPAPYLRHRRHRHHQGPFAVPWSSFPSFCLPLPCSLLQQPLRLVTVSRNSRIVCRFSPSPTSAYLGSSDLLPFSPLAPPSHF